MATQPHPVKHAGPHRLARWLPIAILGAGLIAFFAFDLGRFFSFDMLREQRQTLMSAVDEHPLAAPLAYVGLYAGCVAFSLPVGVFLTMLGGFLFGAAMGTLWAVSGATLGAILLFLAARTAFGEALRARAGPGLRKLEQGFRDNALHYLLFVRLVPLFPFWLVNLAAALTGVSLRTFALGTFLGIVPATFVFVYVGRGLGSVLDQGDGFSVGAVLTPQVVTALALLALLALVPVVYKRWKARRA